MFTFICCFIVHDKSFPRLFDRINRVHRMNLIGWKITYGFTSPELEMWSGSQDWTSTRAAADPSQRCWWWKPGPQLPFTDNSDKMTLHTNMENVFNQFVNCRVKLFLIIKVTLFIHLWDHDLILLGVFFTLFSISFDLCYWRWRV